MRQKIFSFMLILSAFFVFSAGISFAQADLVTPSPKITPTPSSPDKIGVQSGPTPTPVEYTLPYPGLLPDNPLYFLKAGRDKLIEFLISDPEKKAEFYLLSSDKRLNTGYFLIIKGKDDMGVLYISKGDNYLHMAIQRAKEAGSRGAGTLGTIAISIKKHEEVITGLLKKVDGKNRTDLTNELNRLKGFESLVKPKK